MNGPGRQLQATPSLRETQLQPHSQVSAGRGREGKYISYFTQPQTKVIIFSFPNNSFSLSHKHKSSAKSFICPSLFTSHTQLSQVWPISSHPSLESSLNWMACLPGHRPHKDSLNRSLVSPFPSEQYVRPHLFMRPLVGPPTVSCVSHQLLFSLADGQATSYPAHTSHSISLHKPSLCSLLSCSPFKF